MTIALLILALRMRACLPPAPLQLPRPEINWQESHRARRQRRPHFFPALRLFE